MTEQVPFRERVRLWWTEQADFWRQQGDEQHEADCLQNADYWANGGPDLEDRHAGS